VVVLGLSGSGLFGGESAATVEAFRDQTGVTFPLLLGDTTSGLYVSGEGAISPYPIDVIIDRNGVIASVRRQYDGAAMQATLEALLAGG
jgi:hypothetical protein